MASSKKLELAASLNSHGVKRNHSDSGTNPKSCDNTEADKRFRSNKKGRMIDDSIENVPSSISQIPSSSGMNTDSHIPFENCKIDTSDWTDKVLPNFQIKLDTEKCADASNVFTNGISHFIEKDMFSKVLNFFLKGRKEDNEKYECFNHALLEVFNIDCCCIDDIEYDELQRLNQTLEDCTWIDTYIAMTDCNQRLLRRICEKNLHFGIQHLIWQLLYMRRKKKSSTTKEISEGMYQELFVSFVKIFGLNIVSGSNVDKYCITMGDTDFVSTPDAVICHPSAPGDDKIFAVVKVRQNKQDEDSDQLRNTRKKQKKSHTQHIGFSTIGQQCGQLLCTLPYSAFGNHGMYGFIVQGTNVTLTLFKPEDGYYENFRTGCFHRPEAVVTFSRKYNILRKEDRRHLVETFLDFDKLLQFMYTKE